MERTHQCKNIVALLYLASQLQGRFHRICAGRAYKLNFIVKAAWANDFIFKIFDEFALRFCVHVKRVHHAVVLQIFNDLLFDVRVVMPVVQRAGAAKEVDILLAVLIRLDRALRLDKDRREVTAVRANFGFIRFKCFRVVCTHVVPSFLPCHLHDSAITRVMRGAAFFPLMSFEARVSGRSANV